jgi:cell division protein FtsQ
VKVKAKVKAKASKAKAQLESRAKRWMQRLSMVTGIIIVISASVLVAWGLRRYLRTSPRFSVRDVPVEGHQRRTPHQLIKRAGLGDGVNIFSIEEAKVATLLEADPWIETAEVAVDLPNTVRISVVEREARALAVLDGQLYLVDTKGNIFKRVVEGDPMDMPVVTGIRPDDIAADREETTQRVRRSLDLVADLERAGIARRYPIQEVHIDPDSSVTITVGSDGLSLVFGTPPFRAKVAKAARILEELRYRKVKRAVLFLDNKAHPERVVVRMK